MAKFIKLKPRNWIDPKNHALGKEISLWDAVKTKNWYAIAVNYNGPKQQGYDKAIKDAYEYYCKKSG